MQKQQYTLWLIVQLRLCFSSNLPISLILYGAGWPYFFALLIQTRIFHFNIQDVFPVIPGDTDYRIFSQDYGNIPGLDIIFLLGGYFYHTSSDTVERLLYVSYILDLVQNI